MEGEYILCSCYNIISKEGKRFDRVATHVIER